MREAPISPSEVRNSRNIIDPKCALVSTNSKLRREYKRTSSCSVPTQSSQPLIGLRINNIARISHLTSAEFASGLPIPVAEQSVRAEATDRMWWLGPLIKLLGAMLTCTCRHPAESPSFLHESALEPTKRRSRVSAPDSGTCPTFFQSGSRKIVDKGLIFFWSWRGTMFNRNP